MAVKDFMTRKVVYISPDTTIAHAADLMREQGLHRLPVIENDKLVGLVTEGTIAEASPSKATSLSIFEMNYLLNKTSCFVMLLLSQNLPALKMRPISCIRTRWEFFQSWTMTKYPVSSQTVIFSVPSLKYRAMEKKEFVFAL